MLKSAMITQSTEEGRKKGGRVLLPRSLAITTKLGDRDDDKLGIFWAGQMGSNVDML